MWTNTVLVVSEQKLGLISILLIFFAKKTLQDTAELLENFNITTHTPYSPITPTPLLPKKHTKIYLSFNQTHPELNNKLI